MQTNWTNSMLWRRLDYPGHESARLLFLTGLWNLEGSAVFAYEELDCRLDYHIVCDSNWLTRSARIAGWVGNKVVDIEIAVSPDQNWRVNEKDISEVAGCIDLDLNFSPSTNLLPIRRLNLAVSEEAEVRAAWLRFPGFELEPLTQLYRRTAETSYHYESAGGKFVTEITVNSNGFVTEYPDLWRAEIPQLLRHPAEVTQDS